MTDLPIEKELWFEMDHEDCHGKHYIIGNPHTFHGRIAAYCPTKKVFFNISPESITNMSQETKYWIKGYLAGNEPSPPDDENGEPNYPEHEVYIDWQRSVDLFHKTGYWYSDVRHCEECGKKLLNSWPEIECEECFEK